MANETLTTNLPGIVNSIREKSFAYITQEGVMKKLVHRVGGVGNSVEEPYFDKTATDGVSTATEGTDFSTIRQLSTTRRTYTASEFAMLTFLTDQSVRMSVESVKEMHSQAHGFEQAYNLETKLLATFASFTTTVTATATTGLTWAKVAAARTRLEDIQKSAPKPYNLVLSPDAFYYFAANMVGSSNYYVQNGSLSDEIQRKYSVAQLVGGVNVYQTSYLTATSNQTCGLFSRESIALFVPNDSDYKVEAQRDASKRGNELISTFTFGARVRVPSYGIKMSVYASQPS